MNELHSGMIIAGKYRLEVALASGGMGSVWRARHLGLDTSFAIKFINPATLTHRDARMRFEREAKVAALLQSPHVVQIHDYGADGDHLPYLVMELLLGEDLGARLVHTPRLSPAETVNIVTQVARALRRAAEAGIVHRDLKPGNVFIVRGEYEEAELVKVLDFGIAKSPSLVADDDSTRAGTILGSPRYLSPEQARGSRLIDPRSDLWSLAVIIYRALTGQLPFQRQTMTALIKSICSDTPIPPSQLDPSLGPAIDAFFVRALDRDPAGRFQTARELSAAFALAAGQPLSTTVLPGVLRRQPSEVSTPIGTLEDADPAEQSTTPQRDRILVAHSSRADALALELDCEPTRLSQPASMDPVVPRLAAESLTVPEPASRRSPAPPVELLAASYRASAALDPLRGPRTPQELVRSAAIGAGIVIVLGVLMLFAQWRRAVVSTPGVPLASVATPALPSAPAASSPPVAPTPVLSPSPASSEAQNGLRPAKREPEPKPARSGGAARGTAPNKRHGILGI